MGDEAKKKRSVNGVDATGRQVADNVKRLRGGMTYKELSQRMADVGREITILGLRRIESGERKVDVDDLVAFAIVFDVSPLTLLLPESGSRDVKTHITGRPDELRCNQVWNWATVVQPLPSLERDEKAEELIERRAAFRERSKPQIDSARISEDTDADSGAKAITRMLAEAISGSTVPVSGDALKALAAIASGV
ncbi:helix-turn-helix domain-containing protein [Bifidobacterium felsineum]|uniref:helix-turn-helix domain-containing protein n=1 Tax=Bifidobacterium felsineum TaxID=2045440 RepID=UPI001BDD02C7|nr:helix-turn-helix transcriptional regulator [Bifidobacterium felsineum]MBT1163145.1 helix-turn-helix transcriptional regulator [Bifidobacterium felsineum]